MSKHLKDGFTLAELLIIAPIVILVVTSIVSAMVVLTGNVLVSRASNKLLYGLHDTLARINQDIAGSKSILKESITPTNPQGKNNDNTKFQANTKDLIINSYTTSANPISEDKDIIFTQTTDCNDGGDTPLMFNTVYFLKDETLWRRVVVPDTHTFEYGDYCAHNSKTPSKPWQLPSCADGQTGNFCKVTDIKLLDGVTNFTIKANNSEINNCTDDAKITASIEIEAESSIAGRDFSQTASLKVDTICNTN